MAIKVSIKDPLSAKISIKEASPIKVSIQNSLVYEKESWDTLEGKPFETLDENTFKVEGGILKIKTSLSSSYKNLSELPSIEGVTLIDNKTFSELGLEEASILSIKNLFND